MLANYTNQPGAEKSDKYSSFYEQYLKEENQKSAGKVKDERMVVNSFPHNQHHQIC